MTTSEEHIAALRGIIQDYKENSEGCPTFFSDELAALEWAIAELSPPDVTISGNVSSNSLAVKKEGEHGHTSTERNKDRSD